MHLPVIAQYPKMKSSFFENSSHSNSQTRMGMIDGSDGYGEGTHSSSSTPQNPGNNSSNGNGKPRSKDPFDFAALKNQLPPNTGPPGTVATGGNSSNSKNLSHVPCKFFKQGVCQAGNSCPFSHNLDGSLGADKLPCKYFQKGNCKFGLKCALAHFLPDGTRINSKAIQNYRKSSNLNNKNSNNNAGNNTNNISNSIPNSNPNTSYGSSNTYYSTNGGSFSNSNSSSFIHSPTSQQFQLSVPQSQQQNDFILSGNRNSFSSQPIDIGNTFLELPSPGNRIAKFVNLPYQQVGSHSQSLSQGQGGLNFSPFQTQGSQGSQGGQGGHSIQGSQVGAGGILLPQPLSPRGGSFGSNDQYFNTGLNGGLFSNTNSNSFVKTPMNRSYSFTTSPPSSGNNITNSNNFNPLSSPFGQTPPGTTPSSYQVSQQPFSRLGTSNSSFSSTSYYYNNSTNLNDSAIEDDEDDIRSKETVSAGAGSKFAGTGDDFFCEEDYVPGSLSDLILTPQELQRRDSRSQSGTLLVRPNLKALFNDMKEEQEEGETGTDSSSSNIVQSPRAEKANLVHEDVFLME